MPNSPSAQNEPWYTLYPLYAISSKSTIEIAADPTRRNRRVQSRNRIACLVSGHKPPSSAAVYFSSSVISLTNFFNAINENGPTRDCNRATFNNLSQPTTNIPRPAESTRIYVPQNIKKSFMAHLLAVSMPICLSFSLFSSVRKATLHCYATAFAFFTWTSVS